MLSEMKWFREPWLQDCCIRQILSVRYICISLPVQTRVLLIHSILPLPFSSFSAVETRVSVGMWNSWDDASVCSQVLALEQCKTPQSMQTLGCSCLGTPESLWTSSPCWPSQCHNIAVSSAWTLASLSALQALGVAALQLCACPGLLCRGSSDKCGLPYCLGTIWISSKIMMHMYFPSFFNFASSMFPFTILPIKLEWWSRNQTKENKSS